MTYVVKINGEVIGTLERAEIELRAARWQKSKAHVEMAAAGSSTFVPLADFLRPSAAPLPAASSYAVRVGGQPLGVLPVAEIQRRSAAWGRSNQPIEVGDAAANVFVALADFLARPAAGPQGAAAVVAVGPPLVVDRNASYVVRVGGQPLGAFRPDEIQRRSAAWLRVKMATTVALEGSAVFVPLADFLQALTQAPSAIATPPPLAPVARRAPRILGAPARAAFLALGVFCILAGVQPLATSAREVQVPGRSAAGNLVLNTRAAKANGMSFALGISMLAASLLAFNRGLRKEPTGEGRIDRLLTPVGNIAWPLAPFVLCVVTSVWFGYTLLVRTDFHSDPAEAVAAFSASVAGSDISVIGQTMYAIDLQERVTHTAPFTPATARAFDRAGISIGGLVRGDDYPLPGLLPIAALAAIAGVVFWRRWWVPEPAYVAGEPDLLIARAFLAFGAVNLYVLLWLASAQNGVTAPGGILDPEWAVPMLQLVPAAAAFLFAVHAKVEQNELAFPIRLSWVSLYFAVNLLAVTWGFAHSNAYLGSPVKLWLLAYLAAGAACWFTICPAGEPRKAA